MALLNGRIVPGTGKAFQFRADYDTHNNLIYEGWALNGKADTDAAWCIIKHTYTLGTDGVTYNETLTQLGGGKMDKVNKWTERATVVTYS